MCYDLDWKHCLQTLLQTQIYDKMLNTMDHNDTTFTLKMAPMQTLPQ